MVIYRRSDDQIDHNIVAMEAGVASLHGNNNTSNSKDNGHKMSSQTFELVGGIKGFT